MLRDFVFRKLLPSPGLLTAVGAMLYIYQISGLQKLLRVSGLLKLLGPLGDREALAPAARLLPARSGNDLLPVATRDRDCCRKQPATASRCQRP